VHVVILGNGIAGVTTARELRKRDRDARITIVSGESDHHYSRPALMYIFMGHMGYAQTKPYEDFFWKKNRIELVRAWVKRIDLERHVLDLDRGAPIAWDELVVATGSVTAKYGWPGQDLRGVQGLYGLEDLERLEAAAPSARSAVIVGGGLIGIELAEMLHTRGIHVTFLVRESSYWNRILPDPESAMVNRIIRRHGIDLRLSTELLSIEDDGKGRVGAVVTKDGKRIACDLVGITTGVQPNVTLAREAGIPVNRGVLVDASFRTAVPHVYAAGDCVEIQDKSQGKGRVEQLWYTGKMHGEVLGAVLHGEARTYDRGVWFNSAKFFDLEYQTYGSVNLDVEGEENLHWESPDGEQAMRVVHAKGAVIGFNSMGIRYRHRTCERWIREKRSARFVIDNLGEANFDPEFAARHEHDMKRAWKEQLA
jgi:NADPH-dependent 2,4-dienoyl-CoA reductase/sulfur reductase-like enzyme